MNLKFGAEFYNAFNHTQFHDVNTSFGSSAFGQVTDTYDPRVIELSLSSRSETTLPFTELRADDE